MKKSRKKSRFFPVTGHFVALPALCIGLSGGGALAREQANPEIEVLAQIDDPAQGAPSAARTLHRADLEAQDPVTLLDNLALLPGIDAFEKGGAGGGSYLALRGGEPNFTLVVINGVRVNDPMLSSGGGFDFTLIGPSEPARIDLLSGPLSTAYGADALSGVVSLRMNELADRPGAAARMGSGSGGRFDAGARVSVSGKAGSVSLAASARDSGDLLSGASTQGQSAMVAASPALGEGVSLDLFGFYGASRGEGFPEDSGGPALAVIRDIEDREREQIALGATMRAELSADLVGQFRASWGRSEFASDSPGVAPGVLDGLPPIVSDSRFERVEAVASLDWSAWRNLALSLGASLVHEDGGSEGVADIGFPVPTAYSLARTLPGVFATLAYNGPRGIELRAGLRADFPESGKERITPRAGLVAPLGAGGFTLTANYAEGFKQPSLFALGFPLIANPDLLPERSRTLDTGLRWISHDKAWQASVTAYRSVYRDLIDFDPARFTNVNRNRVTAQGLELAASGRTGPVRLIASLTWLDTRSADGATLRFRPEWKGAAAAEWRASKRLALRLDGRFSGGFDDSSVPTGFVRLPGFATFDAQARFKLNRNLEIGATVRNLTDEHFQRNVGTPEPGRSLFVGLHGSL